MAEGVLKTCLNVMRRMPPSDVEDNLDRLIQIRPDAEDQLLQKVDLPLKVEKDPKTGKNFIKCDYNRDGDSFRSPWSNEYYPPIDDGDVFRPSDKLRKIEEQANHLFDVYRHLYFEGGYSSVYCWDLGKNDFAACFVIKKDVTAQEQKFEGMTGTWNSIHVFAVKGGNGYNSKEPAEYKLTSTVMVSLAVTRNGLGTIDLSGSVSSLKNVTKEVDPKEGHLPTMGAMIEDAEIQLRGQVEGIYMQKTKEIVNGIRLKDPYEKTRAQQFASFGAAAAASINKKKKKTTE